MESGGQVGAEVRRLHVIYFISRNGRIEHPHLIRVHHLSRNGVHLRDVKRWLAELRGKDMPESFAWSYKRRYKSGYVWQDLLDEDLITPISDNEYVLKGSEISSSPNKDLFTEEDAKAATEKKSLKKEEEDSYRSPSFQEEHQDHHLHRHQQNKRQEPTTMSSSEIEEEESQTFGSEKSSTLTEDYQDQDKHSSGDLSSKQEIHEVEEDTDKIQNEKKPSSLYKNLSKKKNNKKANNKNNNDAASPEGKMGCSPSSYASATTQQPSFAKSRSYSNGASHLFRNLITCGAIDTNDSAMVTINKRNKPSINVEILNSSKQDDENSSASSKELLQKGDPLGGSQRVFGTNWSQQRQPSGRKSFDGVRASPKNKTEFGSQKANPAYKPLYGPPCSQCGKPFKPEKLHAHMKSCKGMKTWPKYNGPAIFADVAAESAGESENNLLPGYYLTHR